jgi:predicted tellurium resistance membrane protein TerC
MDVVLLGIYFLVAMSFIIVDFWKRVTYFSVLGGIILILLGIALAVDGTVTTVVCNI